MPTTVGEVQLLVSALEEADRIGVGEVPHGQIHHRQQRVDVPGYQAKGDNSILFHLLSKLSPLLQAGCLLILEHTQ